MKANSIKFQRTGFLSYASTNLVKNNRKAFVIENVTMTIRINKLIRIQKPNIHERTTSKE